MVEGVGLALGVADAKGEGEGALEGEGEGEGEGESEGESEGEGLGILRPIVIAPLGDSVKLFLGLLTAADVGSKSRKAMPYERALKLRTAMVRSLPDIGVKEPLTMEILPFEPLFNTSRGKAEF